MERNFYCPICGALQKKVLLEESDNHFVCDGCGVTIRIGKVDEGGVREFTVINRSEEISSGKEDRKWRKERN